MTGRILINNGTVMYSSDPARLLRDSPHRETAELRYQLLSDDRHPVRQACPGCHVV